jgi:hypothetical protein
MLADGSKAKTGYGQFNEEQPLGSEPATGYGGIDVRVAYIAVTIICS